MDSKEPSKQVAASSRVCCSSSPPTTAPSSQFIGANFLASEVNSEQQEVTSDLRLHFHRLHLVSDLSQALCRRVTDIAAIFGHWTFSTGATEHLTEGLLALKDCYGEVAFDWDYIEPILTDYSFILYLNLWSIQCAIYLI